MIRRALGSLALALLLVASAASGCGSNTDGAGCVGVACGPPICGSSCSFTCGCCDGCPSDEHLVLNGNDYVCKGNCYELIGSADAGSDAPSDAVSEGIDCSRVGCSPPPLCSEGCTAACGCCSCAEGETQPFDGGALVCKGGCYVVESEASSDAASD